MPMTKLGDFAPRNPFHDFICDTCGVRLGDHFIYRPDSRLTISTPKHDGKFYCHSDRTSHAGAFHQRGYTPPATQAESLARQRREKMGYTDMRI